METPTRSPGYDLFKLIVAVILLILALILMWISPPQTPTPRHITPTVGAASPTSPPLKETASPMPSPTNTSVAEATATPFPSSTSPPPTATAAPTETESPEPSPTPIPSPTDTPLVEATATPLVEIPVTACEVATSRSRLQVGMKATILRRLNFRSSAGIRDNWLLTNIPGTRVEVVGGPECVPYWTGAYVWWQVRLPDGQLGWSAEGSLLGSFYFMEPE